MDMSLSKLFGDSEGQGSLACCSPWSHSVGYDLVTKQHTTLCDPMDCSPPGSSVHGIFQARILEWVAISFSRGSSQPRDRTQVSCITDRRFSIWATREAPNYTGAEGRDKGWDGWIGIINLMDMSFSKLWGDSEGQGSLACCSPCSHRVGYDLVSKQQQNYIYLKCKMSYI